MKKILFLIALFILVGGANSVKARTSIDMSTATASTNATWTAATNTFAWTAENEYVVIPGLSGDLTGCYIDFTISNACRIDLVFTDDTERKGDWNGYGRFGSGGSKTQDLGIMAGEKINQVKEVRIASTSASGSITITAVSYYYPLKLEFDASGIATVPFKSILASGVITFNSGTGVVTNTDGTNDGYLAIELPNGGIDLSTIKRIDVTYTGDDSNPWADSRVLQSLYISDQNNGDINTWQGSRYGVDFTSYAPRASKVNTIKWNKGTLTGGTITISSIKFTSEFTSCAKAGETVLNSLPWINISSGSAETPAWNMNGTSDTYYGNDSGDATHYVDITEYSELRVYCTNSDDGFRAFFINKDKSGTNEILTTAATWHESEKYYSLDLSTIEKWNNKVALKSIKSDLSWKGGKTGKNIKNIVVYKTPTAGSAEYLITGKGLLDDATTALLANANVTSIDVTGMTNVTATTLTSANPNCLFIANAGKLSNTKNVIVSGNCANLVLTDNKPFKAPAEFTATTSVSYDRTLTEGKTTTVCLPFALSAEEAATMGKFYALTNLADETLTFTRDEDEISANTPYLFVPATTAFADYASKTIAATPASIKTSVTGVEFIGTLASTTIPASDGSTDYYAFNNGDLVKIETKAATLPAFRGYFKVTSGGGARLATLFIEDSLTGINEVSNSEDIKAVNNFEGKVFENGKIVIFKKGMKFNAAGAQIK